MITIGIDAGTSVIKAVAFDDDGNEVATAVRLNRVDTPQAGWSEQDMPATFDAVADAITAVVNGSPRPVGAIALTAQGDGLWLVDHGLNPVGPALLWNDARAAAIFDRWWREGAVADVFGITGSVGGPGSPHALLEWLHTHEPARLAGTRMLTCSGWLFGCLTGQLVSDRSDACSPFGDLTAGGWSVKSLDAFGLRWAEPMLPRIVDGQDRVGALSAAAALRTGLPAGLPVVIAPYDIVSTAHGAGALEAGDATIILGTTLCAELLARSPCLGRLPSGVTLSAGPPGDWIVAQPALVGTGVLEWAATLLGAGDAAGLSELATRAVTSADRPLVLPYVAPGGERAPFYDPGITGSVLGLRAWHQPADFALAVFEGLSLAAADCLAVVGRPERVLLAGGGRSSALWCQLVADACAVEVHVAGHQPGARGAAMCARVLLECDQSWTDLKRWIRPGVSWTPHAERASFWSDLRQRFRDARDQQHLPNQRPGTGLEAAT